MGCSGKPVKLWGAAAQQLWRLFTKNLGLCKGENPKYRD